MRAGSEIIFPNSYLRQSGYSVQPLTASPSKDVPYAAGDTAHTSRAYEIGIFSTAARWCLRENDNLMSKIYCHGEHRVWQVGGGLS